MIEKRPVINITYTHRNSFLFHNQQEIILHTRDYFNQTHFSYFTVIPVGVGYYNLEISPIISRFIHQNFTLRMFKQIIEEFVIKHIWKYYNFWLSNDSR